MKNISLKKRIQLPRGEPGRDGRFEVGVAIVDDPYDTGVKCKVPINIRHDVLVHWKSRRSIDDAQFLAGQRLQNIWYRAGTGLPSSVRYGCDRVDGSRGSDPMPERIAAASGELREIATFLGQADYRLLVHLLCEGRRIEEVARETGGREPQLYIARRARDALGYLADYWGAKGRARVPIRAEILPAIS